MASHFYTYDFHKSQIFLKFTRYFFRRHSNRYHPSATRSNSAMLCRSFLNKGLNLRNINKKTFIILGKSQLFIVQLNLISDLEIKAIEA